MLRRTAIALAVVFTLGFAIAGSAAQAQSNGQQGQCQNGQGGNGQGYNTQDLGGNHQVQKGQDDTEDFDCAPPNTDMNVEVNSDPINLGTFKSDANGHLSVTFSTKNLDPGAHTVTASGGGVTLIEHFTVAGTAAAGPAIPRTGSTSTIPLAQLALALLAVGGLFVLFARRRRLPGHV